MKFKLGDNVVLTKIPDGCDCTVPWIGLRGKIVVFGDSRWGNIGVSLEKSIQRSTHTLDDFLSSTTGIWVRESMISLEEPKTPEEIEKLRIEKICNKIKLLDKKQQERLEFKKKQKGNQCPDSLDMSLVQTAGRVTISPDMMTSLLGALDVGIERGEEYRRVLRESEAVLEYRTTLTEVPF